MFKSLFHPECIFQYEVLFIYSRFLSLPYHVSLLGVIYVSCNLHEFAELVSSIGHSTSLSTAQSSCTSEVTPYL